ncbi:hypothetical protein GCM10022204_22340 [Microlunatus aurantiacus]|uniref:Uncharacterized protein n=1 Tax=Microlunatus aurantiacus TaxID=446786 RepID=A0ABP7DGV4_9ACTN
MPSPAPDRLRGRAARTAAGGSTTSRAFVAFPDDEQVARKRSCTPERLCS